MADRDTPRGASSVVFVGALPEVPRRNGQRNPMFDDLTEHPGAWAEYWADANSVYKAVRNVKRDGFRFEAAVRDGKPYIRAVPNAD